ncbi:kyphoscoliosis peptidase-like [Saccoglossus kowalevskii]|uniref:Kyphoscoliosis peptidase-like n=1 Tax=Saccoglossus kowalevskii TaxID=10224 RepID=A0ABM0MI20_SACKO|nr:PREDICTED: kyphoscoliosis peptidase-like [Saccoglossus kowalevskii]
MGCSSSKSTVVKKSKVRPVTEERTGEFTNRPTTLTMEDIFWEKKKKLIPNYARMIEIDKHAQQAPVELKNSPTELVSYLTQIAQSDLEKFRALFRWEAENVDYDVENYYGDISKSDSSPEGVLKHGKSVCAGYSELFNYLCGIAQLECVNMSGASKGGDYQPGDTFPINNGKIETDHAWNKIKIDGQWYLCDCTWASGYVGYDHNLGRSKFTRCWNELYFLSEPEMFAALHFPVDANGNSAPYEQLLQNPITDINKWSNEPSKDCSYYTFQMETVSHEQGLIETDTNEVQIEIRCKHDLDFWANLNALNDLGVNPRIGSSHSDHIMMFVTDNIIACKVRLPSAGDFVLRISAEPVQASDELTSISTKVITYTLRGKDGKKKEIFPPGVANNVWGPSAQFISQGFRGPPTTEPIIKTDSGKTELEVMLPDYQTNLLSEIVYCDGSQSEKLHGYIYGEKNGSKAVFHLVLPHSGEYRFTVMAKLKDGSDSYWHGAHYLIQNFCPADTDEKYPDEKGLWGPGELFYKHGLQAKSSSTVLAENGTCQLKIKKSIDILLIFDLEKNGSKVPNNETFICADESIDGTEVTFNARLPERGYYKLNVFVKSRNQSGSYAHAGMWLFHCMAPWTGALFPQADGTWGAAEHFLELGLRLTEHRSAIIPAVGGRCELTIQSNEPIQTTWYLIKNDIRLSEDEKKACVNICTEDTKLTFVIKLPESGFYKFELYGEVKGKHSLPYLGCWLLDSIK